MFLCIWFTNFENMALSASKSKVCFFNQDVTVSLRQRTSLKKFIAGIFRREGRKLDALNYVFCTDRALLQINQSFLKHDYYTDIITFDLSEGSGITAEIYISTDRVRENARKLGVPFKSELHRVIFHGALHLCGYKDKKPHQQQKMREREDYYLKLLGISI